MLNLEKHALITTEPDHGLYAAVYITENPHLIVDLVQVFSLT